MVLSGSGSGSSTSKKNEAATATAVADADLDDDPLARSSDSKESDSCTSYISGVYSIISQDIPNFRLGLGHETPNGDVEILIQMPQEGDEGAVDWSVAWEERRSPETFRKEVPDGFLYRNVLGDGRNWQSELVEDWVEDDPEDFWVCDKKTGELKQFLSEAECQKFLDAFEASDSEEEGEEEEEEVEKDEGRKTCSQESGEEKTKKEPDEKAKKDEGGHRQISTQNGTTTNGTKTNGRVSRTSTNGRVSRTSINRSSISKKKITAPKQPERLLTEQAVRHWSPVYRAHRQRQRKKGVVDLHEEGIKSRIWRPPGSPNSAAPGEGKPREGSPNSAAPGGASHEKPGEPERSQNSRLGSRGMQKLSPMTSLVPHRAVW